MLDIEARALIGWYSLASQSERVPMRCFYVKVASICTFRCAKSSPVLSDKISIRYNYTKV